MDGSVTDRQLPILEEIFLDHVTHFVREPQSASRALTRAGFAPTQVSIQAAPDPDGALRPTGGRVWLRGRDVTNRSAAARCRLGIGRAHQVPKPFGGMTVFENVHVGAALGAGLRGRRAYEAAVGALELCGLEEQANRFAESLGLLDRKRLELARAVATDPGVLLLDEIGAGLTDAEAVRLVETVNGLRSRGIAGVWIEQHGTALVHDFAHVGEGEIVAVDMKCLHESN